jgi:hypothetical protein
LAEPVASTKNITPAVIVGICSSSRSKLELQDFPNAAFRLSGGSEYQLFRPLGPPDIPSLAGVELVTDDDHPPLGSKETIERCHLIGSALPHSSATACSANSYA